MESPRTNRSWLVLGMIPTLVIAGLGIQAFRREAGWSRVEVRTEAEGRAQAVADTLADRLLSGPLPSWADVLAWRAHPGGPETEPIARLAASPEALQGRLFGAGGSYPPAAAALVLPEEMLAGSELARAWEEASAQETREPSTVGTARAWEAVSVLAGGMYLEWLTRFRAGAAYARSGRTSEAVQLLESIVAEPRWLAGETGLPLEVLAFRALVHVSDVDPSQARQRTGRLDALCERVLLHWRLPEGILEEFRGSDGARIMAWKRIAAMHEDVRQAVPDFAGDGGGEPVRWRLYDSRPPVLEFSRAVADGVWRLNWPRESLQAFVAREQQALGLPSYLGVDVRILERPIDAGASVGDVLASAQASAFSGLAVSLRLRDPELLDVRQRRRLRLFGAWIGLATLASAAASWGLLRVALRQRQLALQQSDFVAAVSHELRAPLSAVRLLAEELLDLSPGDATRRGEYHALILREARRLGRLVDNVLHQARVGRKGLTLDWVAMDFAEVAASAVGTLRPMAEERGVEVRMMLPEAGCEGMADVHAVTQIVVNLVDNALKHAPVGSVVEVGLARETGDRFVLRVRDHGPGIPVPDREQIFEAFVRRGSELRRETPGVGLGLAIVRQLARAHGGEVRVEDVPGGGAMFVVDFPIRDPDLRGAAGATAGDTPSPPASPASRELQP